MPRQTVHVIVTGRVQGVGFRAWTARQAELLDLDGWVRNRPDGAVEAVFSGPAERVETMLEILRDGPGHAKVERVDVSDENRSPEPPGSGFTVRQTR